MCHTKYFSPKTKIIFENIKNTGKNSASKKYLKEAQTSQQLFVSAEFCGRILDRISLHRPAICLQQIA